MTEQFPEEIIQAYIKDVKRARSTSGFDIPEEAMQKFTSIVIPILYLTDWATDGDHCGYFWVVDSDDYESSFRYESASWCLYVTHEGRIGCEWQSFMHYHEDDDIECSDPGAFMMLFTARWRERRS